MMKKITIILRVVILVGAVGVAAYWLYDKMRDRPVTERMAELVTDEDARVLTDRLEAALADPSPEVRARAARAVGRIKHKRSGQLLKPLLEDKSIDVATAAAFALGLTGQKEYADDLLVRAFDMPSKAGEQAVLAAGRLADSSMSEVISQLPKYLTHPSPDVRRAAVKAVFYANAKSVTPQVVNLLKVEADPTVVATGLYVLARMKVETAQDLYRESLSSPEAYVRSSCLRGISLSDNIDNEQLLANSLNDRDRNVVAQAIAELGRKKTVSSRRHLVNRLAQENDERLYQMIVGVLERQKYEGAVSQVKRKLDDKPSPFMVAAIIRYLAAVEGDAVVILLDSLASDSSELIVAACAESFGIIGDSKVIPRLTLLFTHKIPQVRAAAFTELIKLDSANQKLYLDKAFDDPDPMLQIFAIGQVEADSLEDYLPELWKIMARGDLTDVDVRRSLVEAAGRFLKDSQADTTAIAVIEMGLSDRDYVVRKDAAELYKKLFDRDRYSMVTPARKRVSKGDILEKFENLHLGETVVVTTNRGKFEIRLDFDHAPLTALNFLTLVQNKFYDGVSFHRIIPNFVVQGGCPRGDGWGGPGYSIRCEYSSLEYKKGTVGMATSGWDTGGSQFFVTLSPQPHLDARYTIFGRVVSGMDVVEQLVPGDRMITVIKKEI